MNLCLLSQSTSVNDYLKMLSFEGFYNYNDSVRTRKIGGSCFIIDHIFSRLHAMNFQNLQISDSEGVAYHMMLEFSLSHEKLQPSPLRTFRSIDYNSLIRKIETLDWSPIFNQPEPNGQVEFFYHLCHKALERCSGTLIIKNRFNPIKEWMTAGPVRAIRTRRKLRRIFRRQDTAEARLRYESCNIRLRRLLKKAKTSFCRSKFEEANSDLKKTWRTINSEASGKLGS